MDSLSLGDLFHRYFCGKDINNIDPRTSEHVKYDIPRGELRHQMLI